MNNDKKNLSRNRKRRIIRRIKLDDKMKSCLNKLILKRKRKIKLLIKLKN